MSQFASDINWQLNCNDSTCSRSLYDYDNDFDNDEYLTVLIYVLIFRWYYHGRQPSSLSPLSLFAEWFIFFYDYKCQ